MRQTPFNKLNARLWLPVIVSTALLGGCGGSSSDLEDSGSLYISLTDAEGDFNQYSVDVTALKLYRANGAVVETLPNTTRLDFTRYVDVSEFLTAATVPAGIYEKAEITIDYDEAEISVEDAGGNSIPGQPVDSDGNPLGSLTLTARINGGEGFVIRRGQVGSLTIDFDLEASNSVRIDDSGTSATVIVEPVLIANTEIDDEKIRRARGLLDTVDVDGQQFVIDIRPFQIRDRSHGELTVHVTDETLYDVDGNAYQGIEGLQALAGLAVGTPVVTLGRFDWESHTYTADEVHAGSSIPWNDRDGVRGSVIARDGNRLTLLGASIETGDGRITFNDELTVVIDDDTRVFRQGSANTAGIGDISIGQRISVIGRFVEDDEGNGWFDATGESNGLVHMKYSDLAASVLETGNGLVVDLQGINHRAVSRYDFSGTGSDAANDADPDSYEVDTGSLPLAHIDIGDPVWIRGFPAAFGMAPPDFEAKTVIDVGMMNTQMLVSWEPDGSGNAIARIDEDGLLVDISDAGSLHHLKRAGILTDLGSLDSLPLIVPGDRRGLYTISEGYRIETYFDWGRFAEALAGRLEQGQAVAFIRAQGSYDPLQALLASRQVVVRMANLTVE